MGSNKSVMTHTVIFKEGQPANELFIIKRGTVVCLKSSKDRLIPVFMAKEQDIIGENAMDKNGLYSYSAISITTAELIPVPASDFVSVLKEAPSWLVDLNKTMLERFESTANVIAENRIVHPSIMSEEDFSSSLEVEFKKLLA
jgi:CRP/FNR family cyclic AMP-dependent transcriptional regulator